MRCPRCDTKNTKCVDDMMQVGYIAEIYKCKDCKGTIEVVYDGVMSKGKIKQLNYYLKSK